jgi:hypothetical protein
MTADQPRHPPVDPSRRASSICLVMLVKNEAAIIERCLASVRGLIDRWLIIDAGLRMTRCAGCGRALRHIPGEAVSQPWRDFDASQRVAPARSRAGGLQLWLDADETLCVRTDRPWRLTEPAYAIELQTHPARSCRSG